MSLHQCIVRRKSFKLPKDAFIGGLLKLGTRPPYLVGCRLEVESSEVRYLGSNLRVEPLLRVKTLNHGAENKHIPSNERLLLVDSLCQQRSRLERDNSIEAARS